jgi:hypothetical protein
MMRPALVPPNQTLSVPYTLAANANALVWVLANVPVDVFMVDPQGLEAFQNNQQFVSWGGSTGLLQHSLSLVLPWRPKWHLLIRNGANVEANVQYDLVIAAPPHRTS